MSQHRRFELILFDLGDTLIYFDGDWDEVFSAAKCELLNCLDKLGVSLDEGFLDNFTERMNKYIVERESDFIENTSQTILRKALADWGYYEISDDIIAQSLAAMYAVTQEHWIPEEEAIDVLARLKRLEYRLALISNAADDMNTQVLVDKLGARSYFEWIISSAAIGIRKPNPRIFEFVLENMGVRPENAVMVGDTLGADILGAHNVGIFSIWIKRRADTPANRAHSRSIIPDASIMDLCELPYLLQMLENRPHSD